MLQNISFMLDLDGGRAEILCFIYGFGGGKRFRSLPPEVSDGRLCEGNPEIGDNLPLFFSDIDSGSCLYRTVRIVFSGDGFVLPVDLFDFLIVHVKYVAFAAVSVKTADLPDAVPADQQIEQETEDGKADDIGELLQQIVHHGNSHPPHGNSVGGQKQKNNHSVSNQPVLRFFLDGLTEGNPVYDFFKGNTVTVGLDWQHFGGSAWNADKLTGLKTYLVKDAEGNIVESQHADEVGTYVDFRQDIWKWLTVDAGLRVDWHSVVGTELVPQGGLSFHLTRDADIKALVSKGFRNPVIRDMYMFPPATTDLKPERMMNYELAYTQRIAGKAHVGVNLFYIKGENLINTVRVGGRPRNVNTGDFENWGLELSADYAINSRWSLNGNYSFLRMRTPITGAPEGKLYIGGKYQDRKWTVTAGLQNISGLYIAAGDNPQKENFTLLNASVSYKVLRWLSVFAKGENLLAEKYQTYEGYFMPKATFMGGVSLDF